jgi:RNA polymerase sigma-70 factor (ECF subfamily)
MAAADLMVLGRTWLLPITPLTLTDERYELGAATVSRLQDSEAQALFGFVRRLGLADHEADDAVQEVFARLLTEYGRGISIADPRAWSYRAIYRLAMDQHRLRRRMIELGDRLRREPEKRQSGDDDRITVWAEVDNLPTRQRQVVYLRYRADLPFEAIGQVLGITPSAARSHATQALATLRARLAVDEPSEGRS